MAAPFRYAICNEVYQGWPFEAACRDMRTAGYEGIEIAPFTLGDDAGTLGAEERRRLRDGMRSEGLQFVGLHWILMAPKGLQVTTPDAALRQRSWDHIRRLIDLSADLATGEASGTVLVFGSPQQRSSTGGLTPAEATRNYVDGLAGVADLAESRDVTILIEALPRNQTDVVLSLDEAASLVREIGSPAIQTMFDTHNAVDESEPHDRLIERHFDRIRHVHVNETDGGHPGTGDYDFGRVLRALTRLGYRRWVSLEAFDFAPGAERIARETLAHLRRAEQEEGTTA